MKKTPPVPVAGMVGVLSAVPPTESAGVRARTEPPAARAWIRPLADDAHLLAAGLNPGVCAAGCTGSLARR